MRKTRNDYEGIEKNGTQDNAKCKKQVQKTPNQNAKFIKEQKDLQEYLKWEIRFFKDHIYGQRSYTTKFQMRKPGP